MRAWLARTASVVAPLVLAVAGVATAIHFNPSPEKWPVTLVGWATGWSFALVALARLEVGRGRSVFGRPGPERPKWQRSEVILLAVVLLAAALLRAVAIEDYPIALHNDEKIVSEFAHYLINSLRVREVPVVVLSIEDQTPEDLDIILKLICNEVIEALGEEEEF